MEKKIKSEDNEVSLNFGVLKIPKESIIFLDVFGSIVEVCFELEGITFDMRFELEKDLKREEYLVLRKFKENQCQ